jgi:hypothetical protein
MSDGIGAADDGFREAESTDSEYSRGVPHLDALEGISQRLMRLGLDPQKTGAIPPGMLMSIHDSQSTIYSYLKELDRMRSQTTRILSDEARIRAQCDALEAVLAEPG